MLTVNVTYDIVTPESAEIGEPEERGFIEENTNLRDGLSLLFSTRTNEVDGISAIDADYDNQSIRVTHGSEYRTGARETRELFLSKHITSSSFLRLANLVL